MNDEVYSRLKKRYNEVYSLEPNTLHIGPLTGVYKMLGRWLKIFPFKVIVPVSFVLAVVMFIMFGFLAIKLVSLLQYGF